jgi:serine/threonine protein kinase
MKTCPNCHAVYPNHFAVCPRDATPLAEAQDWSEGTVIRAKYRILSKVGQGGMGAVYKALHTKFDQLRALKVMSGDLAADTDFVKRFEREAVLMSRLQHPNVVRVDDIDESEDGRPFIVMEFVEGQSLRQVIQQEGPLAPLRVCSIAKQAAAGLEAAHLLGMVHRDVKPENIVLVGTVEGEKAKVLDFGIAKLKEARLGDGLRTATGIIVGTPQYLSPEQAMGKRSEELDGRSDLYSLGLVMYQMLTSELPFQADSAAGWMLVRLQEPPRPIRSARPDLAIPEALANLVMRCLEKDRDLRPANARELIREIERAEEEIRRSGKPVVPSATTVAAPMPPPAEPATVAKPRPETAPKPTATSRWARGWRFWVVFAAIILGPQWLLAPRAALEPLTTGSGLLLLAAYEFLSLALGGGGWYQVTRKQGWSRVLGWVSLGLFMAIQSLVVWVWIQPTPQSISSRQAPTKLYTMQELKQANRCPVDVVSVTRTVDSQTQQLVFNLVFRNISSDARVTDWKADTIDFDADGKVLSDTSPENRTPILLEPGQTLPLQLTGHLENVSKVKVVFKEVDYEVTTSSGVKGMGSWINAHFQEDLQKAKQP